MARGLVCQVSVSPEPVPDRLGVNVRASRTATRGVQAAGGTGRRRVGGVSRSGAAVWSPLQAQKGREARGPAQSARRARGVPTSARPVSGPLSHGTVAAHTARTAGREPNTVAALLGSSRPIVHPGSVHQGAFICTIGGLAVRPPLHRRQRGLARRCAGLATPGLRNAACPVPLSLANQCRCRFHCSGTVSSRRVSVWSLTEPASRSAARATPEKMPWPTLNAVVEPSEHLLPAPFRAPRRCELVLWVGVTRRHNGSRRNGSPTVTSGV